MLTVPATIRDYDPNTDTVSVEMTGAGILDSWITGVAIDLTVNRAYLAAGAPATLELPDAHRLCEARVVAITPPTVFKATTKTETGRASFQTDGSGNGSATVTFPSAFASSVAVSAALDNLAPCTISAVSLTQFTLANASPLPINTLVYFTWSATGT